MEMFVCGMALGFILTFVFTLKNRWDLEDRNIELKSKLRTCRRKCKELNKRVKEMETEKAMKALILTKEGMKPVCDTDFLEKF